MRLQNRINLYTVVLFVGLLMIINIVVYFMFSQMTINSELEQTQAETEKIVSGLNQSINEVPPNALLRSYVPIDGMIRIVKEDLSGPSVTSSSEKELTLMEVHYYQGERSEEVEFKGQKYSFVSYPIIWNNGEVVNLQITKSLERVIENLKLLQLVLLLVTIIAMIPVIISSRVLSGLITTPITTMIRTMKEIRESGRFQRIQLEEKRKDELAEMGNTFNHMIEILESNSEKQEQFVSNASHELKTPLTVIESYASLLKRRGKGDSKIFEESVEAIHSEAIRMREMTEQLLLLARPNEKWSVELEDVHLADFIQQMTSTFAKGYGREVSVMIEKEPLIVKTDQQRLKQLLYIFLDNARKYSEDEILITIGAENHKAFITIRDRGIGIPKEDLTKIFDRFYRVDKARSRKYGGTGLGLALAKELADAIGVEISIESLEGTGTTVKVYFRF